MAKTGRPLDDIANFLPQDCAGYVIEYLENYSVHLTVTRKRITVLGDYRAKHNGLPHRISVNGNLNSYSFLITLLHELAHLLTYEKYKHNVSPHGKEWKLEFSNILVQFLKHKIFPEDISIALMKSINNPAASTCGDINLLKVLKKYDRNYHTSIVVEQVPEGATFKIKGSKLFLRSNKVRTRYRCMEIESGKWFLFNGMYEVEAILETPE